MFGSKISKPNSRLDSLIGEGTKIEGEVSFSGGLRVDGHIHGNVIASENHPSTLVMSEKARIEGEILVSHAVINGTVIGPVHAHEYVELQAKSNVTGDVYYKTLEIQTGAVVQGRLVFQNDSAKTSTVVTLRPATSD